jgi:hypothetical protein
VKRLLPTITVLLLQATVASAGLDLTWNACNTSGGDSTKVFACKDPESVATLVGCFQPSQSVPDFVALGISINILTETTDVEPYWHYEPGGCNRSGLTLSDAIPESGCEKALNPWGEDGADSFSAIAAYVPMFEGRNTARLVGIVARSASEPTSLDDRKNYFGFQLRWFTENARQAGGKCDGCAAPVVLQWGAASLSSVSGGPDYPAPPDVVITGPGLRSNCARANGAEAASCAAIPPPRHAWDSLRSMGR